MGASNDLITASILSVENLLNNPTFTWKGETFACVPNTLTDSAKAVDVGFNEDTDFRMTIRLNQFTPNVYPALNDFITYLGYRLLIKSIKKTPHGVFWVYQCELPKLGNK